jgi:peptidylprolyl isomerase
VRRLLTAFAITAALAGCGSSSSGSQLSSSATDSAAPTQGPVGPVAGSTGSCVSAAPTQTGVAGTKDLSKKPQIEVPDTPPPCNLVIGDIVVGNGPAAKAGDPLTMKYVGVLYSTGK